MAAATKKDPHDFEQGLVELESIVEALESGRLSLAESLARYERGATLLRQCHGLLEAAERKIEILSGVSEQGEAVLAPFDSEATEEIAKAGSRRGSKQSKTAKPVDPEKSEVDEGPSLF